MEEDVNMIRGEMKTSIRLIRRIIAILYDVTNPYKEEDCYIEIRPKHLRFGALSQVLCFEYVIQRFQESSLQLIENEKELDNYNLKCKVEEFRPLLGHFSKKLDTRAKNSQAIVHFEIKENRCRFIQLDPRSGSRLFTGDWFDVQINDEELWHPLPEIYSSMHLSGSAFSDAVNRSSTTKDNEVTILINDDGIFLQSQGGIERIGSRPKEQVYFSIKLPRLQLQRACRLIKVFRNQHIFFTKKFVLLEGTDGRPFLNSSMKLLVYGFDNNMD